MRTHRHEDTNRRFAARALGRLAAAITLTLGLAVAFAGLAAASPVPYFDLPGATILPPSGNDSLRVVINVPGRTLALVEGGRLVARWPIAVGRPRTPTPRGSFRILQMAKDPTWAPRGGPLVPPGPKNPLGSRWMRITESGYGIHATNDPGSIGHARSRGCIRMLPADAEALYAQVRRGTRVDILYELEGWDEGVGQPVRYPDLYAAAAPAQP